MGENNYTEKASVRMVKQEEETEIDLLEILYAMRKNWLIILLSALLFAGVFGVYNYFFVTQLYSSTSTIFIINTDTVISVSDLQLSNQISGDYQLIIKGRAVANKVIENLELNMTYSQLQKLISVSNPDDTHAIQITVKTSSADAAVAIVNEVTNVSINEIHNVLDTTEPSIMDVGAAESVVVVDKGLKKYVAVGALLGIFLVVAILVIKIVMDNTIKSEDDVEKHLGLPTLSNVPYHEVTEVSPKDKEETFVRLPDKKYVRPIIQELNFDTNEALSTLRTNMILSGYDKKVFMFTSVIPNEGKSFITYQLARNIAEMKKKVVFLDCDIRNSVMRRKLGFKKKATGLSEYLCGQAEAADIVYGTDLEFFDMVFTGATAPNPTDLFEGDRFDSLVASLREAYDYVIIDTAPLGMVIDAAVIAKKSDAAVIILESGKDDYRNVSHLKKQLEVTDVDIIGVVLNKVNIGNNNYGYGRYGKYGYGKYGKYGYGYGYGYGQKNAEKAKSSTSAKPDADTVKKPGTKTKSTDAVKKPSTVKKSADTVKKTTESVKTSTSENNSDKQ
ncbi:MAG: polysaccharide biosynthesis tyrosine autokinase [Lachnospiraceae bacterium]|nr:polysaccharide biosynthesis tyrosine autokinase [Lachnospiraceae bacterium]